MMRAARAGADESELRRRVGAFRESVAAGEHLRTSDGFVFRKIEKLLAGIPSASARVLEHGCGGGFLTFALLASGCLGVFGVDVGEKADLYLEALNRAARVGLGVQEPRFLKYDGRSLPFGDASFDLVFSVTVLEHVDDACVADYYREGRRVLKSGGVRFDSLPHRLMPYDTHARLWFAHYLPRRLRNAVYRALGRDAGMLDAYLHLRSRAFHENMLRRHYRSFRDESEERILSYRRGGYYKGPRGLRDCADILMRAPGVGALFRRVALLFGAADTVALA